MSNTTTEAAIDIGTNTMLLLIAKIKTTANGPREILEVFEDEIDFVKLGEKVHQNRFFLSEAMNRSRIAFLKYKKLCDQHQVDKIFALATSASRDSKNSKEFYKKILDETGILVQIISGDQEARLSFLGGLLSNQDPQSSVILDIGGGSTEFVYQNKEGSLDSTSRDMGCVRATELFLKEDPYSEISLKELISGLRAEWSKIPDKIKSELKVKNWVGVAGTATTLAAIIQNLKIFDSKKVDNTILKRSEIESWFYKLSKMSQTERKKIPLLETGRADVIVAGAAILFTALEEFGKDSIAVSSQGLRHGVLKYPI